MTHCNSYGFNAVIILLGLAGVASAAEPQAPQAALSDGGQIVARHTFDINHPAGEPSGGMAGGPLIGNGDVGVMQSGPADDFIFFIAKNDFWSGDRRNERGEVYSAPQPVGQVRLATPVLKDATFKTTVDMQFAEIRGEYTKGAASLTSRSWVDANRNLFCIELANKGTIPLAMSLKNIKGSGGDGCMMPVAVPNSSTTTLGATERAVKEHYYTDHFNGEMADFAVIERVLPDAEIAKLARAKRGEVKTFDGKTAYPLTMPPTIIKALTLSGWIKMSKCQGNENIITSEGQNARAFIIWSENGFLRFGINGLILYCHDTEQKKIPLDQWVHVAATYDGKRMAVLMDGKLVKAIAAPEDAGPFFLNELDTTTPHPDMRKAGVATRVMGATDARSFTLEPGKTAVIATAILSDLDAKGKNPLAEAKSLVAALTPEKIAGYTATHRQWWHAYWSKSSIEIPDNVIEQHLYSALYIIASCSRAGKPAPGLYGNWITVDKPGWHGDIHINYNFQAPFYGLYAANHTEITLPAYDVLNQSIPRGQRIAAKRGWKGIHLPVSLGPWGLCPEGDDGDNQQRSNAAYSSLLFIWYWQYTQDNEWLRKSGYTFVRETALFWEDYLKLENGRYVIYKDAVHEGNGDDMNGILSLGLLRTLFSNMIPMSEALGVDADKRAKWQDILDKLSPYTLMERNGKTVFRYSEKGMEWCDGNTLGIQHIYPAGAIGLDSDPKLLEVSRNMVEVMHRWQDDNGRSSWYAACARVGYDPKKILLEMRRAFDGSMPNKIVGAVGGGIENVADPMAVNEMLMQSEAQRTADRGQRSEAGGRKNGEAGSAFVIRVFPCWPKEMPARFTDLRAVGAFLVSSVKKGEMPEAVRIVSEKGKPCTLVNPWPGKHVVLYRDGKKAEILVGERFTFKTKAGEVIIAGPEGSEVKDAFL